MSTGQFIDDPTPAPATPATGQFVDDSAPQTVPKTGQFVDDPKPGTFAAVKAAAASKLHDVSTASKPVENTVRKNWEYARQHPLEDIFDVLGAGQRGVGAIAGAVENHASLKQTLDRVGHDVFHPGDKDAQGHDVTERDTESIRALAHAPTHDAIDKYVAQHIPKELQPYAAGILKGGEDFTLQTLSDPLTYVPIAGELDAVKRLMQAAKVGIGGLQSTVALSKLAQNAQLVKFMPWLPQLAQHYAALAHGAKNAIGKVAPLVRSRTELDPILDDSGRAARIQIENKHLTAAEQHKVADINAVDDDAATTARVQHYTQAMGVHPQSAQRIVAKVLGGTSEERLRDLEAMRKKLLARDTARETADHLQQFGGYKAGTAPMNEDQWAQFARDHEASLIDQVRKHPVGAAALELAKIPRSLMQASLFLNPLPHGLKNVGELAYLAGGPRVVFDGLRSMVTGGVDAATQQRLARIGLEPGYTTHIPNTIWSHVIPGFDATAGRLQEAMGHMEQAWRASLLNELDRKLGASTNIHDEYMKAYLVNKRLGDYRNVNGITQLFQAIGGPWVAFRLGIVPENLLRTIKEHPERILAVARAQEDLQRNRSAAGQHENTLQLGGPVGDFAKMVTDPVDFFTSPATMGALGQLNRAVSDVGHEPAGQVAGEVARGFDPFGGVADVGHALAGHGMPGPNAPGGHPTYQEQSLADRLLTATLTTLAVYFQKQQSHAAQVYQQREDQRIQKQSHGAIEDFWQGFSP